MSSADSLRAFARNSHHVKVLATGPSFTSLLYNCLLAYQVPRPVSLDQAFPAWLPQPDDTLSLSGMIIPIPPMTGLLSFSYFGDGVDNLENQSIFKPTSKLNTVRQAQIYGVLHYSPRLRELSLVLDIDNPSDTRLLAAAISRMLNLQKLDVRSLQWDWSENKFIPTIVRYCPSSLVDISISFHTVSYEDDIEAEKTEEEEEAEAESVRLCMPLLCQENGVPAIPRQGQLNRLSRLRVTNLRALTIQEIFSVFKQCPNLTNVYCLELNEDIDPLDVAMCIGKHCQKLNSLVQGRGSMFDPPKPLMLMDIMSALPKQTVQIFHCHKFDESSADLVSRFLRHSETLCKVNLETLQEFDSKDIQSILVHCQALEEFRCHNVSNAWKTKFDLAHAIEFPWSCTRLKHLRLHIAMDHIEPSPEGPFYKHMPLSDLTAAEHLQVIMLEKLYLQIGCLIDMEMLTLKLIDCDKRRSNIMFPGMLSLPHGNSGGLGYLHLLVNLKKLRVFFSFITSDEAIEFIGQPEVEWIAQNWSSLEYIDFFYLPTQPLTLSCFQWLQKQMPRLKMNARW
ncbi:hypothetical protein BGZ83_004958 [Gryganskiella cystojenkinii]|nr:hypothetical protein BGZ83_004958 [Gryganskiella cystojenkinii]